MPLRTATPSDFGPIVALVNASYRGESARAGWTHEADYISGTRIDETGLQAQLAANPAARLLVLTDAQDAEPLGCVLLEPDGEGSCHLGMLTVRPTRQDGRLGRQLLADAEAAARTLGAQWMRMTVVSIRDTLIAWYVRRGYALTGERLPFPYGDPPRTDLEFVVLEKKL